MLNRRAFFGLPLAALPSSSEPSEPLREVAFECGYRARTHLTSVVGFASLIEDARVPADRAREYACYIQHSATALIEAVDEVLDMVRRT